METYKEKHEQALERAKQQLAACGDNEGRKKMIYEIFPELRETEDEWVRKELIKFVRAWKDKAKNYTSSQALWTSNEEDIDKMLSWLKKKKSITDEECEQGKQGKMPRMKMKWAHVGLLRNGLKIEVY